MKEGKVMKVISLGNLSAAMIALLVTTSATRAAIELDSFNPNADGSIDVIVVQPNGQILVGGAFDATNFQADVNASGSINAGDVALIKTRIGTGLP
jgi:hypothetical protein